MGIESLTHLQPKIFLYLSPKYNHHVLIMAKKPPIPPAPRKNELDIPGRKIASDDWEPWTPRKGRPVPSSTSEWELSPPQAPAENEEWEESGDVPPAPKRKADEPRPVAGPRRLPPAPKRSRTPSMDLDLPAGTESSPPLFIKIDKYRDVVGQLHMLKTYALSLRDALDALAELEKELQNGLAVTHRALDKFNTTIATIDSKLSRLPPKDTDLPPQDMGEMDEFVGGLHNQMDKIRKELKNLEV